MLMDTGFIKTNSVKFYGGWGETGVSVNTAALLSHGAAVEELKKLLKKKSIKTREQFMLKLRNSYTTVAKTLLEEGDVEQALRDGYLRKWQQDLELL
jgi:hypothetical protein